MCRRGTAHASRRPHGLSQRGVRRMCTAHVPGTKSCGAARPPSTACPPRADPIRGTRTHLPDPGRHRPIFAPRPPTNAPAAPQGTCPVPCSCSSPGRARAILGSCVACCVLQGRPLCRPAHTQHATRLLRACCGNVKLCKGKESVKRSVAGIGIEKRDRAASSAAGCRTIHGWQFRNRLSGQGGG
jgi:hypothetical protein